LNLFPIYATDFFSNVVCKYI